MTLSNVSNWSEENDQSSSEPKLLQDIDEDEDDGEKRERENPEKLKLFLYSSSIILNNFFFR